MAKKKQPAENRPKVNNPNVLGLRAQVLEQPITDTLETNYSVMMLRQLCISLGLFTPAGPVLRWIFQNSLYSGVLSMIVSLLIVPVVSLLTQKTAPAGVDDMFRCYDRSVVVHAKTVLGDRDK